ncbi:Phosphatidylinositol 4-kinase gamma 3 [Camellia lanceoleosa]|uniref:Phosphatidylinositol 4-kinase gamma 3 n=1 Tax=Camellia lanceoleosa TaxID=1840588 RepID=A0ACC0IY60_9ERIC|nr:Phosphatidylinositol 4-kinase gamma 3 [Camellia lanceoleosa]
MMVRHSFYLNTHCSNIHQNLTVKLLRLSQYTLDKRKIKKTNKRRGNLWKKVTLFFSPSLADSLIVNRNIEIPLVLENLLNSTFDGLDRGNYPIRSSEGTGGAYFMLDALGKKYISVFKPVDEEPMAVNNPRGLPISVDGEGLKKGTRVEEGALREVAAYI